MISTFLKIIVEAIGFENMQAAFDRAGDPLRYVTLARCFAENISPSAALSSPLPLWERVARTREARS
jgi:hypothetical protein